MPKKFIYFLVFAQAVITAVYLLSFAVAVTFFPSLELHRNIFIIIMVLLSFSMVGFLIVTHKRENFFLNWGNILGSIFLVFIFYFLFASLVSFLLYLANIFSLGTAGWLAVVLSVVFTIYGVVNARILQVTKITVRLPNLPEWWQGKTAVMVSDLHLGQILRRGFARKIIKNINLLKPEIVFIPGDFYDGVHTDFKALAAEFAAGEKTINAPLGVYFCSGNHEMFAGYQECEQALRQAGIKILENQTVELNGLQVAGIAYKQETMPDLPQTLSSLSLDQNKPSVLLKHVPLQLQEVEAAGVDLVLCGHSHLGQIWPGSLITKRYFKGFDYGFKKLGNLWAYTSSGAGTWGPPMRIFTKSEMVKITFKKL